MLKKIKQIKKHNYILFWTLNIIALFIVINGIVLLTSGVNLLSNAINIATNKNIPNKQEVKNIFLTSDGYNNNEGGSFDIQKSAEWTGVDTAQVKFNIDTRIKSNNLKKDVILVLDTSISMHGEKLATAKNAAKELTSSLLSDSENKVALITFDATSKIESKLTNNKEELLPKIDSLTDRYADSNYNQALKDVDKVLEGYEKNDNRNLIVIFIAGSYPTKESPNQVAQYKYLKEKYPYITINGIQYETYMGDIKNISDHQYMASKENINNILLDISTNQEFYENFELVDYIDDDYYYVESASDIKVSVGKTELAEENGSQKVIWTAKSNELRLGSRVNMTINLKLKKQYVGVEGYYHTNKKFEITTKLQDESEKKYISNETPILKNTYNVYYDTNAPTGCDLKNFEQTHYIFENVKITDEKLVCNDYVFKGWTIVDKVNKINDDYFVMPGNDVNIKALWTKQEITKSMDGTVYKEPPSIMKAYKDNSNDDYHNSKYRTKVTEITFSDNKKIPPTAIDHWDASSEGNGTVVAYIEDDGTGNGTYKVTIGGNGKVIANEDSSFLFSGFSNLKKIDFTYFDTSNVRIMTAMFYNSYNLITLDLRGFDTSNVIEMTAMFNNCSNLTTLDLSSFDLSKVESMLAMFEKCYNLTILKMGNFDISNVTVMNGMFNYCYKLNTTINITQIPKGVFIGMFARAATDSEANVIVNYTNETSDVVDRMIATKSNGAHIVKGQLIAN